MVAWRIVGDDFDTSWCVEQAERLIEELGADLIVDDASIADYVARAKGAS